MQSVEVTERPVFSPLLRRYTLQEFWALAEPEDRYHYDLIGGLLFMVPPPAPPHGSIDSRLNKSLVEFLFTNKIEGDVHHPREPIYPDPELRTYLEPDMMYVSQELRDELGEKRDSADIVFEYSSKSTRVYDRTTKSDTYLALGVRELWIIDSATLTIEVRYASKRKDQLAWEARKYGRDEWAESSVLLGWKVSVSALFAGLEKSDEA